MSFVLTIPRPPRVTRTDPLLPYTALFRSQTDGAQAALRRVGAEGSIVPSLWRPEVANVLRNAVRKRRCDEAYVDASLTRLDRLSVTIDHETDEHAWGATRALSREEGLTPYDAAYLELALRTEASLASGD